MKKYVIVPTYNEANNIERLIESLFSLGDENLHVLIVDDHSPDKTGSMVERMLVKFPRLVLLERLGQRGRGSAGAKGFEFALADGAEVIAEMDADFSHPPELLPELFKALSTADIAIASRLIEGATDTRPFVRRLITRLSNTFAGLFLNCRIHNSKVKDWTSGYRAYKRDVFETLLPSSLISTGPSILQEILFRALNADYTAVEIPFQMKDRTSGRSSFSRRVAIQSLLAIPAYRILFNSQTTKHQRIEANSDRHYRLIRS